MPPRDIGDQQLVVEITGQQATRLYRAQNLIWVWFGLATILAALQFYINPQSIEQSAVLRELDDWIAYVWNTGFFLGGAFVAYGTWFLKHKIEFVGHWFLCSALLTNFVAIAATIHGGGTLATIGGACLASATRAWWLYRIQKKD